MPDHAHDWQRLGVLRSGGLLDRTDWQCLTCGRVGSVVHGANYTPTPDDLPGGNPHA